MKKSKLVFNLLFTMMKIGLFTFGGGYAMIALLENEFVSKINGTLWELDGTPEDENYMRHNAIVTSVSYVEGVAKIRYVADECYGESRNVKPSLEDAYIHALGGVKR